MSISTELTRLARNVGALTADTNAIFEALRAKGVDVPQDATLDDVAEMIGEIELYQTYVTIDGRDYKTVTIGNQEWMAENLDYKFSYNGSTIPVGGSGAPSTPAAWYYDNDETSYGIDGTYKCGLLYNWYAAKYLEDNKATLLPNGWHVPTSNDWNTLLTEVGDISTAGTKLKALNNSVNGSWPTGWNGTDDYGFNGIPSGDRYDSIYYDINSSCTYWTSTEYDANMMNLVALKYAEVLLLHDNKYHGFSLRLVRTVA